MKNIKNFSEFQKELTTNNQLQQEFKNDPVKAIQEFKQLSSIPQDAWIYRIVVSSLGCAVLFVIIGLVILILNGHVISEVSTIFTAIASGAIGALAGLLAPSPKTNSN